MTCRQLLARHHSSSLPNPLRRACPDRQIRRAKARRQLSNPAHTTSFTNATAASPSRAGHSNECLSTLKSQAERDEQQSVPRQAQQTGNEGHSRQPPAQAVTLDGRESSAEWLHELHPSVTEVTKALGRPPGLCVIHVGDRPDSSVYVRRKEEACEQVNLPNADR